MSSAAEQPVEPAPEPLQLDGVVVTFGGVHAVDGVSLEVRPGETVGLIGANGAGKTTLMDCISGYVSPEQGAIRVFGTDVTGLPPELRPYLGLGRSFQDARLYPGLTVHETLQVSLERLAPTGLFGGLFAAARAQEAAKREAAEELAELTGLTAYADTRIAALSTGTRRMVDIACILAQQPQLLLLDEPTAGIAQRETEAFGPLLGRLKERLGCAVVLIEHDMPLVMSVCDRIYAMESGRVIAEGPPEQVRANPRVIASYLGTTEEVINRSDHGPAPAQRRRRPSTRKASS